MPHPDYMQASADVSAREAQRAAAGLGGVMGAALGNYSTDPFVAQRAREFKRQQYLEMAMRTPGVASMHDVLRAAQAFQAYVEEDAHTAEAQPVE